jgi:hypothetical protein
MHWHKQPAENGQWLAVHSPCMLEAYPDQAQAISLLE